MNQRGRVFKIKISMTFLYPKLIGCLNSLSLLRYPYINILTSTSCGLFWIEIKWFTRFSIVKMKWKNCQNELWISKYIIEVVDTSSMESSWRTFIHTYTAVCLLGPDWGCLQCFHCSHYFSFSRQLPARPALPGKPKQIKH